MHATLHDVMISDFLEHISQKDFPCIAAHDAATKNHLHCYAARHMGCPVDDAAILQFLYDFVEIFRLSEKGYHSAAVLFSSPEVRSEDEFEFMMWDRLQALADLDAQYYPYDPRVSPEPSSPNFSFSLKSESFYIIGLHPASSRNGRRYKHPALVFNPHAQFEKLREQNHYHKMQHIVRQRDLHFSGSVNPMLTDFGEISEAMQYSGKQYGHDWICPLNIKHGPTEHNTPT